MRTKKVGLLAIVSAGLLAGVIAAGSFERIRGVLTTAGEKTYTMSFSADRNKFHQDSSSAGASGNAAVTTNLGNEILFAYQSLISPSTSWHVVKDGGSFYNIDPIHGLESLSLSFKTNAKQIDVYWSYNGIFSDSKKEVLTTDTSKASVVNFNGEKPAYFKIANGSGSNINISAMDLEYSCLNANPILTTHSQNESQGTVSGDSGVVVAGQEVTVVASPGAGATFVGWYEGDALRSTDASYTFEMPYLDLDLTARFDWMQYSVDIEIDHLDMGSAGGAGQYTMNQEVTLVATPYDGHDFLGWYLDNALVSEEKTYVFLMPDEPLSFEARFIEGKVLPSLSIQSNDGDLGTVSGSTGVIRAGTPVTVTASPAQGANFVGWYSGETRLSEELAYQFEMPYHDLNLVGRFAWVTHSVSASSNDEDMGTVSGAGNYHLGQDVSLLATPAAHHTFVGWYEGDNLVCENALFQFEMGEEDLSYQARFAYLNELNVDSWVPEGGFAVAPKGAKTGDSITLKACSYDGYEFECWMDDDYNEVSYDDVYSFTMPSEDVNLHATFVKNDALKKLSYRLEGGEAQVVDCDDGAQGSIYVPPAVKVESTLYPVTSIGSGAFLLCDSLSTAVLPDSIVTIGNGAFGGLANLKSVELGAGLQEIKMAAFAGCEGLASLDLPNGLRKIGKGAFLRAGLRTVVIPNSVSEIAEKSFNDCESLNAVTLGSGITSIDYDAFLGSSKVWEVTNLSSIDSSYLRFDLSYSHPISRIGEGDPNKLHIDDDGYAVFDDGTDRFLAGYDKTITDIVIPEGVTKIQRAFFYGSNITSIVLPDSLKEIEENTFTLCHKLTRVDFGAGPLTLGARAFSGCENLRTVTGETSITSLGEECFSDCNLEEFNFGPSLTEIPSNAFSSCDFISLSIPNNVEAIRSSAFRYCRYLTSVTLGSGLKTIGDLAFTECTKLTEIINGSSLNIVSGSTNYGQIARYNPTVLPGGSPSGVTVQDGFILHDDGTDLVMRKYVGNQEDMVVPEGVTKIGEFACDFPEFTLRSLTLPNSLKTIEQYAFRGAKTLNSVEIGTGLTTIEDRAFGNCYSLARVVNHSSMVLSKGSAANGYVVYYAYEVIADMAQSMFETDENGFVTYTNGSDKVLAAYYGHAENVVVPSDVTRIETYAFYANADIRTVVLPEGLRSIGEYVFYQCSKLESVTMPDSVNSIGQYCFAECRALRTINLSNGLTSLPNSLLSYCEALQSVSIPTGITSIGNSAFNGCKSLVSIVIPNGVVTIGQYAFNECSSLASVTIGTKVTTIGSSAFYCYYHGLAEVICLSESIEPVAGSDSYGYLAYSAVRVVRGPATSAVEIKGGNKWVNDGDSSIYVGGPEGKCLYVPNHITEISGKFSKEKYKIIFFDGTTAQWSSVSKPYLSASVFCLRDA